MKSFLQNIFGASKPDYKTDQSGIINRYLREQQGWERHLQNTKKQIIKGIEGKEKNEAVVLGSGWWLDVPVEELSKAFNKVYLVDMVHPAQIRHKARKYTNVELVIADINCGLYDTAVELMNRKNPPKIVDFKAEESKFPINLQTAGYVVSVNLLNQLDILLIEYIRKYKVFDNSQLNQLRKYIQTFHLSILPVGKTCLITDCVQITATDIDSFQKKQYSETNLIFTKLPKENKTAEWLWYFDTQKTYFPDKITIMKVRSYLL